MSRIQRVGEEKYRIILNLGRDRKGREVKVSKVVDKVSDIEAREIMNSMELGAQNNYFKGGI